MLRAASKTLSVISFAPLFKEGQNLDANESKSTPVPEDDAEAMETLSRICHSQSNTIPEKPGIEIVVTLARLVDKDALVRTVCPAA